MPYLSFDKSIGAKPIAIVRGGKDDGEILYIQPEDNFEGKSVRKPSAMVKEIDGGKVTKQMLKMKVPARHRQPLIDKMKNAKSKGLASNQFMAVIDSNDFSNEMKRVIKDIYQSVLEEDLKSTEIELVDDGMFQIVPSPDPKKHEVIYIAGPAGAGKSYIARGFAEIYRKLFPTRDVYLISKLENDETLDTMKPPLKRISIQSLVDDPPKLEEFNECLVIFDDYDSLEGAQSKIVHQLIDDLAILGRHKHEREDNEDDAANSIICITHYLTNYKKTRLLLNESTHFVVYPQGTSGKSLNYLLGTHVGMSKDDVQDLKKLKSRWVCVCKQYPQYMISQQTAKILN